MCTSKSLFRVACMLIVVTMWLDAGSQAQAAATGPRVTQGGGPSIAPAPSPTLASDGAVGAEGNVEPVTERYPNGKIKIERQVTKDAAGNYVNHGTYTRYDVQRQGPENRGFPQRQATRYVDADDRQG